MSVISIHIHEDDWGMRNVHPIAAFGEVTADIGAAVEASERNRAPDGIGWTDVHIIEPPSLNYGDVGLTFDTADAVLAPIMPRVRNFFATSTAGFDPAVRDPHGSYDDAYCYGFSSHCFIKLDGAGDTVQRIWFQAPSDPAQLKPLFAGLIALDALVESVIADYWLDATGRVRDGEFMTTYMRHLIGEDD
ncbi:MAG: hypothetical protein QM759_06405 [Terricaulis sp.]